MQIICFKLEESLKENLTKYYTSICQLKFIDEVNELAEVLEDGNTCKVLVADIYKEDSVTLNLIAKAKKIEIPVIVLSDDYQLDIRSRYLLMGASLVLKKPSSAIEVIYSVKAICNQYKSAFIADKNFTIDLIERKVWYRSNQVSVSPQLFDILVYFVNHDGKVVKRCDILKNLYPDSSISERSIDTLIKLLRKITDSHIIETRHGIGYIYDSEAGVKL